MFQLSLSMYLTRLGGTKPAGTPPEAEVPKPEPEPEPGPEPGPEPEPEAPISYKVGEVTITAVGKQPAREITLPVVHRKAYGCSFLPAFLIARIFFGPVARDGHTVLFGFVSPETRIKTDCKVSSGGIEATTIKQFRDFPETLKPSDEMYALFGITGATYAENSVRLTIHPSETVFDQPDDDVWTMTLDSVDELRGTLGWFSDDQVIRLALNGYYSLGLYNGTGIKVTYSIGDLRKALPTLKTDSDKPAPGYTIKQAGGGGDCMFHSISLVMVENFGAVAMRRFLNLFGKGDDRDVARFRKELGVRAGTLLENDEALAYTESIGLMRVCDLETYDEEGKLIPLKVLKDIAASREYIVRTISTLKVYGCQALQSILSKVLTDAMADGHAYKIITTRYEHVGEVVISHDPRSVDPRNIIVAGDGGIHFQALIVTPPPL